MTSLHGTDESIHSHITLTVHSVSPFLEAASSLQCLELGVSVKVSERRGPGALSLATSVGFGSSGTKVKKMSVASLLAPRNVIVICNLGVAPYPIHGT